MKKIFIPVILLVAVSFILSGCVVRTYRKTQERVDQNLGEGNRGYLMATTAEIEERDRPMTRTTQIVEVELSSPIKFDRKKKAPASGEVVVLEDQFDAESYIEDDLDIAAVAVDFQEYTVTKNDTLQKISEKFYGTTKRWPEIYQANQDILDGPDQIKPGQVLNIPTFSTVAVEEEGIFGPAENIK